MTNPIIPSSQQPLTDPKTGKPTQPWYLYLQSVNNRIVNNAPPYISLQDSGIISLTSPVIVQQGGNDTIDTAANYINATQYATAGNVSYCLLINTSSFSWVISPVNSVTFIGNLNFGRFVIPGSSQRMFLVEINSTTNPAITIYG